MIRLLGILPDERRRVALLLLHYVWVVAVTIAGKSVRDAYFLNRYDRSLLPLMGVAAAIAVAASVALFTKVERRLQPTILIPLVCIVFAASLALLHFRLQGWTIPVLYVWMEVINVLTVLQFWLLAAELLDPRQAKRLFPLIGGGGSFAAILIGPQLKPFSKAYGSDTLLWLVCALLLGAAAVAMVTTRLPRLPVVQTRTTSKRRSGPMLMSPYLRMIGIIVICTAVVSAIVDYQFKILSSRTLQTETDLVGFFGQFYAVTGISTLVLQFIVAGRAFQLFGVVLVMAVLPVTLGLGSLSILLWPVLWSAVSARFSDQTFRFTLHNGGLELLWLPVSPNLRSVAKPFITGSLKSITEGAAGVMIFVLLYFLTVAQLSIVALLFCGAWAVSLSKLKSLYVAELQSAIANRRLPPEDLEVSATDALTVQVIDRALAEGDAAQRLFVLGMIAPIPLTPWRDTIQRLLEQGEPEVKARILQLAAYDKTIVTNEALKQLATKEGTEAIEAIRVIGATGVNELRDVIMRRLDDSRPGIRAAAYATLTKLNGSGTPDAREALENMLRSSDVEERVAALEESSRVDGVLTTAMLGAALADPSREVRARALETAATHPCEEHARLITASLSDSALFVAVRTALAALPSDAVLPVLMDQLDKKLPLNTRRASLRAMRICPSATTYSVLLREVDGHWPALANQASESLLVITRKMAVPADAEAIAQKLRSDLIRTAGALDEVVRALPNTDNALLIRDYLETSISRLLPAIIRLASLNQPDSPIEPCIQILHNRDRARLPFVLELFDTLLTPAERHKISSLLERYERATSRPGTPVHSDAASPHLLAWLKESVNSEDEWLRAIALDYVLSTGLPVALEQIDWQDVSTSRLIREVFVSRIRRHPDLARRLPQLNVADFEKEDSRMLTTLEKTILLKSVPLFQDIPGEELSRVAQIAEEQTFAAQSVICRDGDPADCLYVIVSGSVRIQKRGREIALLTWAHPLGEMAVLDSSVRSADAIAVEETIVLRVGQEQFLEIMQSNAQIMQGVVRMLLARLRRMDEQLADKVEALAQTGSA